MSFKKHNSYGAASHHNRNGQRGSNRERHPRQRSSYEQDTTDSRAIQILRRILNDDDDANFTHRINNTTQLIKLLEESRNASTVNTLQFRQEQMKLLDICIHDERLRRMIEMPKAPSSMKQMLVKVVSGLACYTRLDLALSWIFDRLSVWPDLDRSLADIKKDHEWKKWLLCLLNQVLLDSAADQYTYRQTMEMSPTILEGVLSFLDSMESFEYLPTIIDILIVFSNQYPDLFAQRFTDIVDLLVGWNMDASVPDSKKSIIISSFSKFDRFWMNDLAFIMELLNHLLTDVESAIGDLRSLYRKDMKEYKQRWDSCMNIFRMLDVNISPLLALRQKHPENKKLKILVLVLLRSLLRARTSAESRASINQKLIEHFEKQKLAMKKLSMYDESLKPFSSTTALLERNHYDVSHKNVDVESTIPGTIADIQLFGYLLLDIARIWPEYSFKNLLVSADMLCMAWAFDRCDIFVFMLRMLFDYWSSTRFMLNDENGFDIMCCIVSDAMNNWIKLTLESRRLLCDLAQGILTTVCNMEIIQFDPTSHLKPIIHGFISATNIERNKVVKESMLNVITYYCQLCGSADMVDPILRLIQISINDPYLKIQDASKDLVTSLNPFLISQISNVEDNTLLSIQNAIMATPHTGTFRPVHYEIVMKHLGMGKHLVGTNDTAIVDQASTTEWARRLLHHCDAIGNLKNTFLFSELCEDATELDSNKSTSLQYILLLLDRLELQISNATDGCATGTLPAVPRPSLVFFRTNKKTCKDYFSRIRPMMINGAKLVRNEHLLIVHIIKTLKEMESTIPVNPIPWFKEVNEYLRDLVEVCIRKKYTDMINGLQSWYKKVIRKACQISGEFKENWIFEGCIGPLQKRSDMANNSTVGSWFQVAAYFAYGRDEQAIKSLSQLKAIVATDDYGIIGMLNRQAIDFYTCLEDYDSISALLASDPMVADDYICQSLCAFNSGENIVKDQQKAFYDMQEYVKTAPLETCIELSRLDTFRHWLIPNLDQNDEITMRLTGKMLNAVKGGISSNITNLMELQLLYTGWEHLVASARDWYKLETENTTCPVYETKRWAHLSTFFESLYNLNEGEHANPTVTQYLGSIQLHTAKIARKYNNISLAEKLIEKAAQFPSTKYNALYERAKIQFNQFEYAQAMDTLNGILSHIVSAPEHKELKSKTYRNIARYLKSSPEDKVSGLLGKLNSNLVKRTATELQSSVEASIDYALEKSIETDTVDGRPWFEYATHHYKQGWRILDELTHSESTMTIVVWAKNQIQANLQSADQTVDAKQTEQMIIDLLLKYSSSTGSSSISSSQSFMSNLRQLVPFLKPDNETSIVTTLEKLQKIIIDKFQASAQAYFRYLSLDIHIPHHDEMSNTSMVTTATLRLLRILSKYGTALQSVYQEYSDTVRIDLWKRVTPQLFAQLNHPNEFVRQMITKLICRICDEYPRDVIYDVIVSSSSSKTNRDTKQMLNKIANRMMEHNELLWVSTSRMAEEIQKMTILVEEDMMNTIGDLQFEVMRQFNELDKEIVRLDKSVSDEAKKEKTFFELYCNLMKPIISTIDRFIKSIHGFEISERLTPHQQCVVILPTKTKPKKLDFKGSDGKKYSYLFKGHEDLHLDERIMQLLTTTNGLLSENERTALRGMRARTYAVIPLGDRSGMIQWVDEATPLYALFKKWQKRESAAHIMLNNDKPNEAVLHALSLRPTECFANKVYSALKAAGLRVSSNRKHWPKHILKKVYLELLKETPEDLLEKEFYYSSSNAEEWINKTTSFARSLAVTSMIGYIIGLGDRHLDNMLVDFRSGEMIHIDYNVCFEKGRRLRVPELVPYRLTQNLHAALGITGVDGPFRTAAEETLCVLRKHKEVLITLLDAFVYDPLVDWEYEAEEVGHRQMKELQRGLGLIAAHINRQQTQLEQEHQTVVRNMAALEESLDRWHLFGSEYMNEEEADEEGDEEAEEDSDSEGDDHQPENDPHHSENEATVYRVPMYVLNKVKDRILCVKSVVSRSRSPLEGILPLLESIIIIETDDDNELRPAQKAAKSVLDTLIAMECQLKKLDKQIDLNQGYESEWTYTQLSDFVRLINKLYEEYASSLKILEEFGPDNKASSNMNVTTTTEELKPSGEVADEETEYEEQNNGTITSQQNKPPKNTHVAKLMKRIRSKLEGVDFGIQHKMSVSEQVSKTIEQATSVDNLCLMYEGWTSWV
ncbi:Serine/threonine-protein kinase smg1 [Rhizopus azygosporus]|uniref:non-specific serine/threonine protein kinase n=1 Tax=Rhizopus azygosporus TaxID=86630 RepID=A0A367K9M8_RHIAZ|nr:Serine/threonine-protein kinase smg1 [Rhizopus azygosporus]